MSVAQIRSAMLARIAQPAPGGAGSALTDGWGASRLSMAMLGPQGAISLRRASAADEALLLRWANDTQVRANSFSPEPIAPSDHHHWFQRGLANTNRLLLIATAADGCLIGQIRFDRQTTSSDEQASEARVDLSLDRCARGHGLASELVRLGLQVLEQRWGPATDVVAEVLPTNSASNACFSRAGFVQETISPVAPPSRPVNRWRWCPAASPCSAIAAAGSTALCQS